MGEQDHALHEIADARARIGKIADELALHAQPDRVKTIASAKVSEWKELAKEKASEKVEELKQQARDAVADKATGIKTRAKEAVMHGTTELKERADTPRGWSLLGAIAGAGVGAVLMKKAFSVRQERSLSSGGDFRYRGESYPGSQRTDIYGSPAAGMSGEVSTMGSSAGIMGAVEQVRDQASHLLARVPSGRELKGQASGWFNRALETQPLMLAVGGIALGMFASMFLPVTNRERQLIEPAKRKAQESITQLGDQLEKKLQGNTGSASAGMMGAERPPLLEEDEELRGSMSSPTGSRIPPVAPLDDLTPKIH
jgi:hypothetical protein